MQYRSCLIIEDSGPDADVLKEYIAKTPFFLAPQVCSNILEASTLLQRQHFDLIFLDIKLPGQSGLDLLRLFPKPLPVIVTTAYPEFAVECYDLSVADYLLKPFTFSRFTRALNRALGVQLASNSLTEDKYIFLKVGHSMQRFDYDAIDYIQAFGTYCKVFINQKVVVVNEIISHLENILPKQKFLRIHKSYLTNLAKINSYNYRSVVVGSAKLPLGASYREKFEGFLNLLDRRSEV
ncbi:LytR/AlgR family response regulator transcription factor [Larkinella arboricola]|uniref:LytTR family two component transcriptional regulator n=1 Tax=Larkinella arboricola TaxID=643671 RepID=A0A327WY89_LARAB|nr:LytTR family DNA-binding domain-containing protein [Larkinella arboricola]RAJ97500.1 LytTR family two component transcriptional regulator [Larkinella arboricola]